MPSITVLRPVAIKAVMTDLFRAELIKEAKSTLTQIEANLVQFEKLMEEKIKQDPAQGEAYAQQLMMERERTEKFDAELTAKLDELKAIEDGREVLYQTLNGPVEIGIGDNLITKMAGAEIVVKDWKVVEIRQGNP